MRAQILKRLSDAGIRITLDSDNALVVESPQALTRTQRDWLKEHRAEIISALKSQHLLDDRVCCVNCEHFNAQRQCLMQPNRRGGYWQMDDFYARTLWRCHHAK